MPSWEDLERPRKKKRDPSPDDFSMVCARLFSTPDGVKFMEYAKFLTVEKVLHENASQSALWQLEGERKFVRRILHAHDEGLTLMATTKKTA